MTRILKCLTKLNLMKKLLLIALLLRISLCANAQGSLSASAKNVLHTIEQSQRNTISGKEKLEVAVKVQQELHTLNKNNTNYIATLIKVDPAIDTKALTDLGIIINTKAGDIWTALIPLESFGKMSNVPGIKTIDTGGQMQLLMDEVRKETKADEVHQGINLSCAYFGENVVVGIIDEGFDYTHPNFYDPVTKKSRISRVWNQTYDEAEEGLGLTPPAGYNYGMEIVNLGEIIKNINANEYNNANKKFYVSDATGEIHGTHTAGIATGSGWGTNGKYQGIAPKAEIVMVAYRSIASANIVDAIQYIFKYAASVHKPAVINLSAGTIVGPHDGTSLLCQGINNLTGEGKIMVNAAGNDGAQERHLSYTFSSNETVFSLLGFTENNIPYTKTRGAYVDCWASAGTNFSAKVMVYKDGYKLGETPFISASSNGAIIHTIVYGKDTVIVNTATEAANPNNNRPNIFFDIDAFKTKDGLTFKLAFTGNNTTIHAWGNPGFVNTRQAYYVGGDDLYSIMDGPTAEKVITVGAYAVRNKYININNVEQNFANQAVGDITAFSSKGPTLDGRTKPDITAPGFEVISSISSIADYNNPASVNAIVYSSISPLNGRTYKYAAESGTSMASPVVAGAVALMLEANPKLNPQQVLTILKNTARKDNFTGSIPASGSNTWGWGKINIQAAVKASEIPKIRSNLYTQFNPNLIYPNPVTDMITITLPENLINKPCSYTILDLLGKQLATNTISPSSSFTVPVTLLPKGVYLLKVTDNATTITNRFIKQ